MTVILHNYIRVNAVVQSLIIDLMHPLVYFKKKYRTRKTTLNNVIIKFLKEVVLLIMHPKLLQMIFHNI